jgi:hypothetical protein
MTAQASCSLVVSSPVCEGIGAEDVFGLARVEVQAAVAVAGGAQLRAVADDPAVRAGPKGGHLFLVTLAARVFGRERVRQRGERDDEQRRHAPQQWFAWRFEVLFSHASSFHQNAQSVNTCSHPVPTGYRTRIFLFPAVSHDRS